MATHSSIPCLESHGQRSFMHRGQAAVHGVAKSWALHYTILLEKIFSFISLIHKQTKDYIETHTEYIMAIIIFK